MAAKSIIHKNSMHPCKQQSNHIAKKATASKKPDD